MVWLLASSLKIDASIHSGESLEPFFIMILMINLFRNQKGEEEWI